MKKLSVISLSLVLALSMMPVTAFATIRGNSLPADASLVASQSTKEIRLTSGVSTGEVTIGFDETVDYALTKS